MRGGSLEGIHDNADHGLLMYIRKHDKYNKDIIYQTTYHELFSFIKSRYGKDDISFIHFDESFIKDFHYYLKQKYAMEEIGRKGARSLHEIHQVLQQVASEALKKNLLAITPYKTFKLSKRQKLKKAIYTAFSLFGYEYLGKQTTVNLLENFIVLKHENLPQTLPRLISYNGTWSPYINQNTSIAVGSNYVWEITDKAAFKSLKITPSGSMVINRKVLDLDYGNGKILPGFKIRKALETNRVIIPWTHQWGSYYDFLIIVIGKLCRIEKAIGKKSFQNSDLYFSFRDQKYEMQILNHFCFKNIYDSKEHYIRKAESLVTANSLQLYYPSIHDIKLLRQKFLPAPIPSPSRLIFVNRCNTRKVSNWNELLPVLRAYNFEIIDPGDYSFLVQIEIFSNAKIVMGPHGAGLTNILWCKPGTAVLEYFSNGYFPPYYYYLSHLLSLSYGCFVDKTTQALDSEAFDNKKKDIRIDIDWLENHLSKTLT